MTARLLGIGRFESPNLMPQAQAAEISAALAGVDDRGARRMNAVFRRAGVETRSGVSLVESEEGLVHRWLHERGPGPDACPGTGDRIDQFMAIAPDMACAATRDALERAGFRPDEVTHVVTVSCTGFASPGVDHHLIDRLGLPRSTRRTNIGFMGCHAALNGLRVATAFARAEPEAVVVVCCVEVCSVHFQGGDSRDAMLANALFADGSAAAVVSAREPRTGPAPELRASVSEFLPDSTDLMTWTVTDQGFRMTLAPEVPDRLEAAVGDWARAWLGAEGYAIEDLRGWAIHPGGPQIIDAVRDSLGIDESHCAPSRAMLARLGNMSSPTVLHILAGLQASETPLPWAAMAFGPGLSAEGLLLV